MRRKGDQKLPRSFATKHMQELWESEIPNLETLKQVLPGSVLVALDTEPTKQNINGRTKPDQGVREIGLAMLAVAGHPSYRTSIREFQDANNVEATTIKLSHKRKNIKPQKCHYSVLRHARFAEASSTADSLLPTNSGKLILVGYALFAEFRWISKNAPELASRFSAWVDAQELMSQKCMEAKGGKGPKEDPGLGNAMRALHIRGAPYPKAKHSAGTDVVRCLAVIAGLLSDIPVDVSVLEARKGPRLCTHLPRLTSPRPHSIRITTYDGGWLPDYTPNKLVKVFGNHGGLIAVGLNRNGGREVHNKFWWLQFEDNKFLEDFCTQVNGSILDGVKLRILRIDVPEKAQLQKGSQSMPKCENTGRERRDWQADILALDNLVDIFEGGA